MLGAVVMARSHLVRRAPAEASTMPDRGSGAMDRRLGGAQFGPPAPIKSAIPGIRLGRCGRPYSADAALS